MKNLIAGLASGLVTQFGKLGDKIMGLFKKPAKPPKPAKPRK